MQSNLLALTHDYTAWTKDQVESMATNLNHIDVLVRYKPVAEFSRLLPFEMLKYHRKDNILDTRNIPENLDVIPTPMYYLPTDKGYKRLGEKHYWATERTIADRGLRFNIIHAHFAWSAGYAAARLKEKYNVPFVLTVHGYDIYDLPLRDTEWQDKIEYVLNTADFIITVSHRNLDIIKKLNVSTPAEVVWNGFRSDQFYPRDTNACREFLGLPQDKKIILFVGSLVELKGVQFLIEAVSKLSQGRKDILCLVIGVGEHKRKFVRQIKNLQISDFIKLIGAKPHQEIPLWMNACDLVVLPSLAEGNPVVMFESLGCGKPFIGSNVGGIPEIIVSDDYGFLIEPASSDALARAISRALRSTFDRNKILKYSKLFTWETITKRVLEIYEQLGHKTDIVTN